MKAELVNAIAQALSDSPVSNAGSLYDGQQRHLQWTADVEAIADVLAKDSKRFDRERFFAMCEGAKVAS